MKNRLFSRNFRCIFRSKITWHRTYQDLARANITREEAEHTAMNRPSGVKLLLSVPILTQEELRLRLELFRSVSYLSYLEMQLKHDV